jgi:hypothetical protein
MSTARPASVRELLEDRFSKLLLDLESALAGYISAQAAMEIDSRLAVLALEVRERARLELAEQLNQGVRRIRQAGEPGQIGAALLDAAAPFVSGAALLRVENTALRGERIRGAGAESAEKFRHFECPLAQAPAFAAAVSSRDPITAMAGPSEIPAELAAMAGQSAGERVMIYPVAAGNRVPAVLYCWGEVQGPAIELLAMLAGAAFETKPAPAALLTIGAAKAAPTSWDSLSTDEQQVHLRAQRAARVRVAEMRLFERASVESGRAERDLYGALRERIDEARESFRKKYFGATPTMVDYLHLELVHTLANDDPELLGEEYPGPLR